MLHHNWAPLVARGRDLPHPPELVVVATPPGNVRFEVEQGLEAGARCFVVITTSVGEPASVRDESELAELVRSRGARLLGPNCMGVVDHAAALRLCWGTVPTGQVGLVVDAAVTLLAPGMQGGDRVAVVTDGGGQGALAADVLAAAGLSVPPLQEATVSHLRRLLPAAAGMTNPGDLAGAGESDIGSYGSVVTALLTSPDTNSVVLSGYFGDYATSSPQAAQTPVRRIGQVADVAHTSSFLASEGAGFVSGQVIYVAGGPLC
jgi:acyl-CoA synthetase (NDP forming)